MRCRVSPLWIAAILLIAVGLAGAQQQYGSVSGTVTDEQGGVLPGVTVTISSSALIAGSQTVVTGAGGTYAFRTLPPGVYSLSFSLTGFTTLTQEEINVNVSTERTINPSLAVGGLEETVTVTGESPIVDVRQNITQTNIDAEIYENVPTARNPWEMAGLVPGMITGQMDVGGNRGMQQYQLEVMGSANSQKSFSIDGLKVNWPGGSGGWTMQYYDFGMFEEYNFQTSAMTAESDVAGVYMNMTTKSGGNNLSGNQSVFFNNDAMQGTNTDEESSLGGNPTDIAYDLQGTLGGPIVQDKAWFFASGRWWRLDQFLPGTAGLGDDGGQVLDDNRITNLMGRVTYQINEGSQAFVMFNKNWKYRYHRNRTGEAFAESAATSFQKQPAQNIVLSYNTLLGNRALLDVRFGRMWGETPYFYNEAVTPEDIAFTDNGLGQALRAAENEYFNPNHRNQFNANISYFLDQTSGSHDLKFGIQIGRERFQERQTINQDLRLEAINGVADQVILTSSPTQSDNRLSTWAAYIQDSWTIGTKLTLNLGVRFDGISGEVPAQSQPAGTWTEAREFPANPNSVPDWSGNAGTAAWRSLRLVRRRPYGPQGLLRSELHPDGCSVHDRCESGQLEYERQHLERSQRRPLPRARTERRLYGQPRNRLHTLRARRLRRRADDALRPGHESALQRPLRRRRRSSDLERRLAQRSLRAPDPPGRHRPYRCEPAELRVYPDIGRLPRSGRRPEHDDRV